MWAKSLNAISFHTIWNQIFQWPSTPSTDSDKVFRLSCNLLHKQKTRASAICVRSTFDSSHQLQAFKSFFFFWFFRMLKGAKRKLAARGDEFKIDIYSVCRCRLEGLITEESSTEWVWWENLKIPKCWNISSFSEFETFQSFISNSQLSKWATNSFKYFDKRLEGSQQNIK